MSGHPFGLHVDRHLAHKKVTEAMMNEAIRRNREQLARCTWDFGCPASLHHPGCLVV